MGVGAFISVEGPATTRAGVDATWVCLYVCISANNVGSVKAWRFATTRSVISETGSWVKSTVAKKDVVASFSCSSLGRFGSEISSDGVVGCC